MNTENKSDHPFPIKEIELISKIRQDLNININDVKTISDLLQKYLDLRAFVFHEI